MAPKLLLLFLLLASSAAAQEREAEGAAQPGRVLYRQLRSVGLDASRVYRVRETPLDAEDIHITLTNGTIAFSESVEGKITAAFFEGEGEVLLVPPDRVERASLALFTGAAILEEKFTTAFLRFNDNTFERLQPYLRPAEDTQEFVTRWDPACRNLAEGSALQLLESFTYHPSASPSASAGPGRVLHARLSGSRLGTFDVFLNSDVVEQISLGQANHVEGAVFYDIWTSFPMRSARQSARRGAEPQPESEMGRAAVRIARTQVRARIVPPQELHAEAALTLEPTESGVRTLIFELSRYLRVSAVTADEQPAEFIQNEALQGSDLARRGNDLIGVVLPQPLVAGRSVQLHFRYAGPVMSEAGAGLMYVGARGTWYPNRGPAMSQFDLEFRYPSEWTLLATGKRVSLETVDGEQVARWVSERPTPLAGFNLGKYIGSKAQAGETLVESFASHGVERDFPKQPVVVAPALPGQRRRVVVEAPRPPTPVAQAQDVAQRSARTIDFLSRRIGPFPFSSLTLSQMPGRVSLGWPGLIFLSSYAFLRSEERRRLGLTPYEDILYGELMQAHETAHQWWGDTVFWKSYRDVWLAEALANYCALLEMERERPDGFRAVMEEYRRDLLREVKDGALKDAGPVTLGRRLVSSRFPDGYQAVVYGRGTWLLHMLRHLLRGPAPAIGSAAPDPDARFFQVLHTLRQRFEGRQLSTADLQKAFQDAMPPELHFEGTRSLDWFFEGWVQGTALPRFELEDVRFSPAGGKRIARGKLLQKDAPDTLITSVPLYAATASGNVFVGRVFTDGPETEFRLTVPAGSRKLLVDPLLTVLTRP